MDKPVGLKLSPEERAFALVKVSQLKREALLQEALLRAERRKLAGWLSGVLALMSGASITTTLTSAFGNNSKPAAIISAVVAFLSGVISLWATAHYEEKETRSMFDAASEFQQLSNRTEKMLMERETAPLRVGPVATLQQQYAAICKRADPMISRKRRIIIRMQTGHNPVTTRSVGWDEVDQLDDKVITGGWRRRALERKHRSQAPA